MATRFSPLFESRTQVRSASHVGLGCADTLGSFELSVRSTASSYVLAFALGQRSHFSLPREFWMAVRNLKRRRTRSALTISGIAVGVTLIVALASISETLNSAVEAASSRLTAQQAAGVAEVSRSVNMFLAGVCGVAFLIAGLGIMNTMLISVAERKREIGIMKAVGAGKRRIMQVFMLEAVVLGVVAGATGCILGFGLTKAVGVILAVSRNAELSIDVSFRSLTVAFLVALVSAILWGAYPSWRASCLKPVEALRNE